MNTLPLGDSDEDNISPSTEYSVGPIRSTGKSIPLSDFDSPTLVGLRKHNYYNAKNAANLMLLITKWHGMKYEDCYMPARPLGLSPDSLRVKLNCARAFMIDNMTDKPDVVDIAKRTEFSLTNLGVVMRLTDRIGGLDFADVMKRGEGPVDPVQEAMRYFESNPPPRKLFVLRDLKLTPSQLEWFRQTLAQCKAEYEGEVNESQVVIVKLI